MFLRRRGKMNIFNETLKVNQIECNDSKKLYIYVAILTIFTLIALLLFIIIKNELLNSTLSCIGMAFLVFILYDDMKQPNNSNSNNKKTINPSNPLSKLYIINEPVCSVFISLWKMYNIQQNPKHSVSLDEEKINKIKSLFEKLDNQLMSMLTEQDNQTLKLLKPEDIDSYRKLYMLIFAPEKVKDLKFRIKYLQKNFINNKDFYLLEQLEKITQECDEKLLNENDYFKYKKWYNNIDDLIKDMVEIIEDWLKNINNEKYFNEAEKRYYKQILKHIYN